MEVNTTKLPTGQELVTLVKFKDEYQQLTTGLETNSAVPAVRVFPTFAGEDEAINVELSGQQSPRVEVTIFDLSGKLVWEKVLSAAGNDGSYRIRPGVKNGMYLLQVRCGSRKYTQKVVITP